MLNLDRNETNRYAQQCYDATWALAFALNRTITGKFVTLSLSALLYQQCSIKDTIEFRTPNLRTVIFRTAEARFSTREYDESVQKCELTRSFGSWI